MGRRWQETWHVGELPARGTWHVAVRAFLVVKGTVTSDLWLLCGLKSLWWCRRRSLHCFCEKSTHWAVVRFWWQSRVCGKQRRLSVRNLTLYLILSGRRREIVSEAAYSLFYRLRTSSEDLKTLNYEKIKQVPDQQFLDEIRKYEESKKKWSVLCLFKIK